jgi:hypothetical protein
MAKSYADMEKLLSRKATELNTEDMQKLVEPKVAAMRTEIEKELTAKFRGQAVAKPEDYSFSWSADDIKDLPAEMRDEAALGEDDMVKWWRSTAHEMGLGNEQFMKGLTGYFRQMNQVADAFTKAEMAALGENAPARVEAVRLFIDTNIKNKEQAAALKGMMKTADSIAAIEPDDDRRPNPSREDGSKVRRPGETRPGLCALDR